MRAMQSSTSVARSVSTRMREVSTGCRFMVASVTTPVSPMPPAVAQNTSGWVSGLVVITPDPGVASFRRVTASQNEPSRYFPWMSEAMAPPTVT